MPKRAGSDEMENNTAADARLEGWMRRALQLAAVAGRRGEVPVGAVVVCDGRVIGEGSNANIGHCDPSAHAEILALRQAANSASNHRLTGATVLVTLEPCAMCVGALIHSRVQRLIFAAREPKTGAVVSCIRLLDAPWHNHNVRWSEGLMADESSELLRAFFQRKRDAPMAATDGKSGE